MFRPSRLPAAGPSGARIGLVLDHPAALVTAALRRNQPFPVDALVLEEDTWFALSAEPVARAPDVHPIRAMTEAWEMQPAVPGSVHLRAGWPVRVLAVVHDLTLEPSWREEWIRSALRDALETAQRRGWQALGIEPLGCVHGRFEPAAFDRMLQGMLGALRRPPRRVWRIVPPERPPTGSDVREWP